MASHTDSSARISFDPQERPKLQMERDNVRSSHLIVFLQYVVVGVGLGGWVGWVGVCVGVRKECGG